MLHWERQLDSVENLPFEDGEEDNCIGLLETNDCVVVVRK